MLEFEWDEENIAYIARHGVTPVEAEYVLRHMPLDLGMQDWHIEEERFAEAGRHGSWPYSRGRHDVALVEDEGRHSIRRPSGDRSGVS